MNLPLLAIRTQPTPRKRIALELRLYLPFLGPSLNVKIQSSYTINLLPFSFHQIKNRFSYYSTLHLFINIYFLVYLANLFMKILNLLTHQENLKNH
jgi:hypothetical protein